MSTSPPVLTPEDIDGSFVPVGSQSVASVDIDGEVVLLDGSTGTLRNLDPVGGVVWGCLDAPGTIDEIVSDLCAEFGADRDTVRNDVLELMRALGREGLLQGVSAAGHHAGHDGHGHAAPAGPSPFEREAGEPRFLEEPPSS